MANINIHNTLISYDRFYTYYNKTIGFHIKYINPILFLLNKVEIKKLNLIFGV